MATGLNLPLTNTFQSLFYRGGPAFKQSLSDGAPSKALAEASYTTRNFFDSAVARFMRYVEFSSTQDENRGKKVNRKFVLDTICHFESVRSLVKTVMMLCVVANAATTAKHWLVWYRNAVGPGLFGQLIVHTAVFLDLHPVCELSHGCFERYY